MHHETHRVTAYATGLRTQTTEELRANRLFLWNHTHRCIITISGMYHADCRVSDGLPVPRSAERTAELTTRIPDATHAGPVEEIGEYDLGVYVPDDDTDRLYLATADPAGSDWRGVIAHVPSEHVYEVANVPPTGDEPLFDELVLAKPAPPDRTGATIRPTVHLIRGTHAISHVCIDEAEVERIEDADNCPVLGVVTQTVVLDVVVFRTGEGTSGDSLLLCAHIYNYRRNSQ